MNNPHNTKGFTLIEVLIAMVILTIGILTLYSMQIGAIKGNSTANSITTVASIARDQMEQILAEDFDNVVTTSTGGTAPITSIDWNVSEWKTDGIDNDGDGKTDEYDERGVKSVQLVISYRDGSTPKSSTFEFLKTEIF